MHLKEMDYKIPVGGLIGYGNSCMDCFLQTPKSLDCMQFYMTRNLLRKKDLGIVIAPSLPSSCFLGHVNGLFFCLFVEIFASSVYGLFDC